MTGVVMAALSPLVLIAVFTGAIALAFALDGAKLALFRRFPIQ
jgi:hypothetical protein